MRRLWRQAYKLPAFRGARTVAMLSVISGLIVGGAGGATLWYLRARDGVIHPLIKNPWLESTIPIGIATAIAFGVALIASGVAG